VVTTRHLLGVAIESLCLGYFVVAFALVARARRKMLAAGRD
jgi:hypothetical protein